MELGLWDRNQEVHLQLLRLIRKTASRIITGEKNFTQLFHGGSRIQQENTCVPITTPECTSHEALVRLDKFSEFAFPVRWRR
jgi:hypothetical protein